MMSFSKTAWALLTLCWLTAEQALTLAAQRQGIINEMQQRQQDVAALDAKYTQELTGARMENDRLRADIAAGRRQLRIRAACHLPATAATSGVGHAGTIGLSSEAGQAVFDIRAGIISDQQKLKFLQQYIREQYFKQN